jgi:hypothetical protein
MPAGAAPLGLLYFVAAKFAGYTAFCRWAIQPQVDFAISSGNAPSTAAVPNAWKAGGVRTLIGVGIGAVVGLAFWSIPFFAHHDNLDEAMFFGLLIPVRVFEWWLLLHWIYKTPLSSKTRTVLIIVGILVSFALDVIGVVTVFVVPGGVWVC